MYRSRAVVLVALALPILIGGCSPADDDESASDVVVTVTTTAPDTTAAVPTRSATPSAAQAEASGVTGGDGASAVDGAQPAISSCGDSSIHQRGTTFFADGTTGWTEYCGNVMDQDPVEDPTREASQTPDAEARDQAFADEYWATHPKPTFDPDSADGYGPNQELPPACLRLQGVHC